MSQRPDSAAWLERQWYTRSLWQILLLPLSALFGLLAGLRRSAYRLGLLSAERLPVPVIVVGNISVGGTGKTPLVLWLVKILQAQGFRPGVISRGYGGKGESPRAVAADSDPGEVGDEPVLLAQKSGCPVWVGRDRVAAARAILQAEPAVDVLVSDDGLQHYRLVRDAEIVVVDGARGFGNRHLLPAGPLREGVGRLATVDAVVVNGGRLDTPGARHFGMRLTGDLFYNLAQPQRTTSAEEFRGKRLHGVAGIGNPGRFFDQLRSLELAFEEHVFPDHHPYRAEDLIFDDAEAVLMTEKDAVKCRRFAANHWWALAVAADVDPGLAERILEKIRKSNGSEAA